MHKRSNINGAIEQYLKHKSSYAILINGNWGIGKTHHVKNEILPKIKKIKTKDNISTSYESVYLSLFGINSIQQLEKAVFFEMYRLNNQLIKNGIKFGKVLGGRLFEVLNLDLEKAIKDLELDKYNIKSNKDIVFFFDDIERKGEQLSLTELFGYINNLSSDLGFKVILICNDKFFNAEIEDYKTLSEKVIGLKYEYIPDFKQVFNNIIDTISNNDNLFKKFIKENIEIIEDYSLKTKHNLRILIYCLNYFKDIFYLINRYIVNNSKEKPLLCKLLEQKLIELLVFSMAICIEFKYGHLSYSDEKKLHRNDAEKIMNRILHNKDTEKTYLDDFIKNYYSKPGAFNLYRTIFAHFTGGHAFDIDSFIEEFKSTHNISDDTVAQEYQTLQDLNNLNVWPRLSDDDYELKTHQLYRYATAGKYRLDEYPLIFQLLIRCENVMNITTDVIIGKLKEGMDISYTNKPNQKMIYQSLHFVYNTKESKHNFQMIIDYSEQLKNKILQNNNESRFTILKEKLLNYPMEAWRLIKYNQEFQMYQDQPFLNLIDYSEFENTLSKFSNSIFNDFIDFCTARYQHGFKDFEKENGFFENLKQHLEKYLKENKIPTLRRWLTIDLLQRVNTLLKPE